MRTLTRACRLHLLAGVIGIGCSTPATDREASRDTARLPEPVSPTADSAPAASATSWYDSTRVLDLTGDGQGDRVRLVAIGTRPESLQIVLTLIVGGEVKHREAWGSSYELMLVDSAVRQSPQAVGILRSHLDSVLASVVVERIGARGVRLMAEDSAPLARVVPRPTHRIAFAYGFESSVRLVWDARNAEFVRLWSCC